MKIITTSVGEPRTSVLDLPLHYEIKVTRDDGYAPSQPEIYAALKIALDGMTPEKKKRLKAKAKDLE